MSRSYKLSIIIPCHNEAESLRSLHSSLVNVLQTQLTGLTYEIIYIDDGSSDSTNDLLSSLCETDEHTKLVSLSRNFGKENALTAGISMATGEAVLTLDADGQHPVELIPQFVSSWRNGYEVVVGVRTTNHKSGFIKRTGSKLFYYLVNKTSNHSIEPFSTDFRLIDKVVQAEFIRLTEHGRLNRSLIDWLGFRRTFIPFEAPERIAGKASYNIKKLFQLALDGVVSLTLLPLRISLYLGIAIVPLSVIVALSSVVEMLIGDPWNLNIHGTAYVALLVLFGVGILLISQGFIGLYLSRVLAETQNRPLFVVDNRRSRNL